MIGPILLYLGAAFTLIWGIAHLVPTRSVIKGFGMISEDNRKIITMEWIVEGVSLIFIGLLTAVVTWIDPKSLTPLAVYLLSAASSMAMAAVVVDLSFMGRCPP